MEAINTGGPAFPRTSNYNEDQEPNYDHEAQEGMSLRQFYASKFAASLISMVQSDADKSYIQTIPETAFRLSDMMLAFEQDEADARSKGSNDDG